MKIAIIIIITAAALLVFVLVLLRRKSKSAGLLKAGESAPDFTLNSQESKPVSLQALRGKWVVLYFYPKDLTPGCTIEARHFQRDLPQYEQRDAVILGVSTQDESSHQNFCAKEGLHFKLLADRDRKVSAAYGSLADYVVTSISARHTFLIDPEGRIAKAYESVQVSGHSEEILKEIDALIHARIGAVG